MADLTARSPAGLAPFTLGTVALREAEMGPITALMPYRGKEAALSNALEAHHGLRFPAPNRMTKGDGCRIAWSGLDQAFLFGTRPHADLAQHGAVVDQSDAWTHLSLDGADVEDVMARLVPVDLSIGSFPVGTAIRSSIGHMSALILRRAPDGMDMLVFRSMAGTALHDLDRAMRAVAARAEAST